MAQIAVIGLGNFGYYLACELSRKGHEVIALDVRKDPIQKIRQEVSEAIVADGTNLETLKSLGLQDLDVNIVAIGTNMLASILTTFNLQQIRAKLIYAKALSEEHAQILKYVGAHHVVFPEKDMALTIAQRIHNPNMIDYLPFHEDYAIFEFPAPLSFYGKTLQELDLINRYSLQVIAIKKPSRFVFIPRAKYLIEKDDILIILGLQRGMEKLSRDLERH
ncbi:MAG: TrkA family potassium uptake protein [Syntrophobacterales bacterium]|nr:TrkA family potassium uptake protein [Syntrophobacterales bacterium]